MDILQYYKIMQEIKPSDTQIHVFITQVYQYLGSSILEKKSTHSNLFLYHPFQKEHVLKIKI